jgi:hypothetical protein
MIPLDDAELSPPPNRRSFWWYWGSASITLFALMFIWSLASPTPSGPDEPTEFIKADAVAHGTLIGKSVPHVPSIVLVRVSGTVFYATARAQTCVYRSSATPGGCAPRLTTHPGTYTASTYIGRYPPLYYLFAGIPTLLTDRPWVLNAMRAVGALVNAVLLATAFAALCRWSRSVLLVVALAISVTPEVFYLGSVVNPSSIEVTSAVGAWVTASVLVFERSEEPPAGLLVAFAVCCSVLCLSRPLSPLWVFLLAVAFVAMCPHQCRRLAEQFRFRVAASLTAAVAVLAGIYILLAKSYKFESFPLPKGTSAVDVIRLILGGTQGFLTGAIGAYGAPDTYVPFLVVLIWLVGGGGLVTVALMAGQGRAVRRLAVISPLYLLLIPYGIILSHAFSNGITWQGRYGYPLSVGVPILAGGLLSRMQVRSAITGRIVYSTAVAVGIGTFVAFYWLLRRYTIGIGRGVNPTDHIAGAWSPPIPPAVLLLLGVLTAAAYAAAVVVTARTVGAGHGRRRARPVSERAEAPPIARSAP